MVFKAPQQQYTPPPQAPDAPPNPPMFGQNAAGATNQRKQAGTNKGFQSTILGGLGVSPTTSNKTLLGQ